MCGQQGGWEVGAGGKSKVYLTHLGIVSWYIGSLHLKKLYP